MLSAEKFPAWDTNEPSLCFPVPQVYPQATLSCQDRSLDLQPSAGPQLAATETTSPISSEKTKCQGNRSKNW